MKFVSNSIQFTKSDGSNIQVKVSMYHRVAIGLFPGTTVYATPIRNRSEIIISTINPKNWGDIWEIKIALRDTPGAIKSIVDTLTKNNIEILIQESLSDSPDRQTETMNSHELYLVVDLSKYDDEYDGNTDHRNSIKYRYLKPNNLINNLIGLSKEFVKIRLGETDWCISVKRLYGFSLYTTI